MSFTQPNPITTNLSQGFPLNALSNPSLPSLFSLDPHFTNPNVMHWQFRIQQQLGWNTVFEIAYAGSKGTHLYEFRNVNAVAATSDPNANYQDLRNRSYLGDLYYWCACNSSTYHSLQTKVEKRLSNGLSFLTAFTFGKSIDEQSNASLGFHSGGGFRDNNNPEWEKGPSDFDQKYRFVNSLSYSLPFGEGKRFLNVKGVGNAIDGESNSNGDAEERPNRVAGVSVYPSNQGPNLWFNPAAFTATAPGAYGNSGRNIIYTSPQVDFDTSLFKDFSLHERAKLQFRAEVFNMFNHPNFRANSLINQFDAPGAGAYTAAQPARQIQFALKLVC